MKSRYESLWQKAESSFNEEITVTVARNREKQTPEIKRIIAENTSDKGLIDFQKLHKVSQDFARDEANRGKDRFHQAADILEQAYISKFVKGDEKLKEGLQNVFDFTSQQSPLFEIYARMEPQEVLGRLKYLAQNELKSASYKGMDAEQFTNKAFDRYAVKYQFQAHNKALGIKDTFLLD